MYIGTNVRCDRFLQGPFVMRAREPDAGKGLRVEGELATNLRLAFPIMRVCVWCLILMCQTNSDWL
jgi:hypothetical protein